MSNPDQLSYTLCIASYLPFMLQATATGNDFILTPYSACIYDEMTFPKWPAFYWFCIQLKTAAIYDCFHTWTILGVSDPLKISSEMDN